MDISVIILNWNGRRHLADCFAALAAQTRPSFETIMVDNASQDDSVTFVRQHFPWVRQVVLPENRGFPGGNAAGLAAAKGDAIVLLNNDTRPEPDWLEQLHACAVAHPEAGSIASHLTNWDGTLTDSAGDGCRITGRGFGRHRGQPASTAPASGLVFGACAGAALYRRAMIDEVGFLDEDFFLGFEDSDFSFRAQLRGWSAWFCREAVVRHRMSATQGVWSAVNAYYGARNHLWVWMKNLPGGLLVLYFPVMFAEVVAMFFAAAQHRRAGAYLRGIAAGVAGMPRMWRKRRVIQSARRCSPAELKLWLSRPELSWRSLRRLMGGKT